MHALSDDRIPVFEEHLLFLEIAQRSAGMGSISLDPVTMQLSLSRWVQDLIGAETPTIAVSEVPRFLVPSEQERVLAEIASIVAQRTHFEFETIILTSEREPLIVRVAGDAVYAEGGGDLIGFYAILQDIDAMRRSEAAARAAAERAEQDLRSRTAVAAVLSHEIRTPLTGIIGIIDHLRREPRAEERSRAFALIEESARALLATVDTVLRQAQGASDNAVAPSEPFDPVDVARRVAELFRPLARRKGLALELFEGEGLDAATVTGSAAQLQQILANTVSNAIKFTSAGKVTLSCLPPQQAHEPWRFSIVDTGSGIAQARLDTIFAPFAGSAPDSLGRNSGTGLGLSIVQQMVDELGGTIALESEPGKGTRVAIAVPYVQFRTDRPPAESSGNLVYHCAAASRAVTIVAIAERAGFAAAALADSLAPDGDIFICDEELWADLPQPHREAVGTKAILVLGEESNREHPAFPVGSRTIAASHLARDLPAMLRGTEHD